MLSITSGDEKLVYAPDVQGPMSNETAKNILTDKPDLLILGGSPLYLEDFRVSEDMISLSLENITYLTAKVPVTVIDHHLLRSAEWGNFLGKAFKAAEQSGNTLVTAAEFDGDENNLLESRRQELYEKDPPSKEFLRWARLQEKERGGTAHPI
jgi:hypothetical protein